MASFSLADTANGFTHTDCRSGIGMSGWNPAITDEVHKVGVRQVSCITLGVSELSELEGYPE